MKVQIQEFDGSKYENVNPNSNNADTLDNYHAEDLLRKSFEDSDYRVGDIIITVRTDLGNKWAECNRQNANLESQIYSLLKDPSPPVGNGTKVSFSNVVNYIVKDNYIIKRENNGNKLKISYMNLPDTTVKIHQYETEINSLELLTNAFEYNDKIFYCILSEYRSKIQIYTANSFLDDNLYLFWEYSKPSGTYINNQDYNKLSGVNTIKNNFFYTSAIVNVGNSYYRQIIRINLLTREENDYNIDSTFSSSNPTSFFVLSDSKFIAVFYDQSYYIYFGEILDDTPTVYKSQKLSAGSQIKHLQNFIFGDYAYHTYSGAQYNPWVIKFDYQTKTISESRSFNTSWGLKVNNFLLGQNYSNSKLIYSYNGVDFIQTDQEGTYGYSNNFFVDGAIILQHSNLGGEFYNFLKVLPNFVSNDSSTQAKFFIKIND